MPFVEFQGLVFSDVDLSCYVIPSVSRIPTQSIEFCVFVIV